MNIDADLYVSTASKADFPRLLEIWEAAVRASHHFLSEADIDFFRPLVLNDALPAVRLACARNRAGDILGFIGTAGEKIEMLFVDPQQHRKGIGRFLINYAQTACGATTVDVNEQNPGAVAFYRSMGFEVEGRSDVDSLGKPFPLLHLVLKQSAPLPH